MLGGRVWAGQSGLRAELAGRGRDGLSGEEPGPSEGWGVRLLLWHGGLSPSYPPISCFHRNETCDHWLRIFIPSSQPGEFTLGNIERES